MNRSTRRTFLEQTAAATTLAGLSLSFGLAGQADLGAASELPWYRRTLRWGQTNITEIDPAAYDIGWWRQHWKRTRVQGVILNAGGIVAYYPSKYQFESDNRPYRMHPHLGSVRSGICQCGQDARHLPPVPVPVVYRWRRRQFVGIRILQTTEGVFPADFQTADRGSRSGRS
jgi:hypothetical protein